jgi:hypothetical protein
MLLMMGNVAGCLRSAMPDMRVLCAVSTQRVCHTSISRRLGQNTCHVCWTRRFREDVTIWHA